MPTSLTYIVLSTRGCSPWRPAAVIGTTGCDSTEPTCLRFPRTFTGSRERTGRHNKCGAMPESDDPISGQPDSREHTPSRRKGNSSRGSRRRLRVRLRCRQRPRPPPHSGSGILTRFPFGAWYLHPMVQATRTTTWNGHPFQANRGTSPSLRTDLPVSNCCSHGTLLHFSLQDPPLNICYYHQDPHRKPLRPCLRHGLHCHVVNVGTSEPSYYPGHAHFVCPAGVGQLGATLQRHPFSGLVDSAGESLHTP